ncbi:MAG: hypothetical protein HYT47_02370 [Candidatus Vogelbacteria bacterium]|nr:hypothetical protein [Candidatus Vogelbacteria bacterium]
MSDYRNEVFHDQDFLRDVRRLPIETQRKLSGLIELLEEDAFDPRLHTKPLSVPLQGIFTFRITRDYRVALKFRGAHLIQLLLADKRDKIYERLKRRQ